MPCVSYGVIRFIIFFANWQCIQITNTTQQVPCLVLICRLFSLLGNENALSEIFIKAVLFQRTMNSMSHIYMELFLRRR